MDSSSTAGRADLSNWRQSPHNQWAFVNIDKILKTETVGKSDAPSPLPSAPRSFDDFHVPYQDSTLDLPGWIEEGHVGGLMVLQHGKALYEGYFRGNDAKSRHIVMSMTKSVTGLLLGMLQQQGKLNVNDLVTKYVPEVSNTIYNNVTIRQCIDMRSGAKYHDDNHEYRCAAGWNAEKGDEKFTNLHDFISNFDPMRAEDDRFEYVSVNTDLIGWVIERAGGKKFSVLVQDLLWKPMGAESDALVAVDKEGNARAAGGLCATLRDIARIGQLIAEGGRGVVPSDWIKDMVEGGDLAAFAKGSWATGFQRAFQSPAYRSHWISDSASDVTMALGIFGQMLFVDRKNGIVMAKTASQADPYDFAMIGLTVLAFKEVQRILTS
ncbi:Hypothetical predicted protein [Lecanosticta acicola]|uniref:Beta-lactamase-related domain-containing protein n=1 Tax=Lecanosticta acicola TaxID=111012 RepID=A0AAI8Z6N1_9PEZI|nr:Hypothetical predicted protein [Lecanosticta acicola]